MMQPQRGRSDLFWMSTRQMGQIGWWSLGGWILHFAMNTPMNRPVLSFRSWFFLLCPWAVCPSGQFCGLKLDENSSSKLSVTKTLVSGLNSIRQLKLLDSFVSPPFVAPQFAPWLSRMRKWENDGNRFLDDWPMAGSDWLAIEQAPSADRHSCVWMQLRRSTECESQYDPLINCVPLNWARSAPRTLRFELEGTVRGCRNGKISAQCVFLSSPRRTTNQDAQLPASIGCLLWSADKEIPLC